MKEPNLKRMSIEEINEIKIDAYMSKEQTPITADQQTIKDLWNAKTADEIATILKKHTNAKVLEALEREVPKAYQRGLDLPLTSIDVVESVQYYETKVKPNYD